MPGGTPSVNVSGRRRLAGLLRVSSPVGRSVTPDLATEMSATADRSVHSIRRPPGLPAITDILQGAQRSSHGPRGAAVATARLSRERSKLDRDRPPRGPRSDTGTGPAWTVRSAAHRCVQAKPAAIGGEDHTAASDGD